MKILVHTPISNRAWIFPEWWRALEKQFDPGHDIHVLFDVNDSQDETEPMIRSLMEFRKTIVLQFRRRPWDPLNMSDHSWSQARYSRMRIMRNEALRAAEETGCDYLFSLDSDVLLHDPDTLSHLIDADVPIIAGVFMAKWGNPEALELPNVWQCGQNEMTEDFLQCIAYETKHVKVGGLGACTLIRRDVWEAGVTYDEIYNLPSNFRGEDRNFCIRAAVAGFDLIACAHKKIEHRDKPKIESEVTT